MQNSKSYEEFDKFDHSNIKKIWSSKDIIKNLEREAKNWEKIFVAHIFKRKGCYPEYT